ncbi:hypothetical protein [Burkholderia glumae]|uniref:hypothetical protein n=1 Tax=Burkholderia glumae TaxID=337 RepID=UPI0012F805F3|nr:hypothetical protein [Burkholderia glumae]MCM2494899.1 hypothetical protein [Burkholderia glumae]
MPIAIKPRKTTMAIRKNWAELLVLFEIFSIVIQSKLKAFDNVKTPTGFSPEIAEIRVCGAQCDMPAPLLSPATAAGPGFGAITSGSRRR